MSHRLVATLALLLGVGLVPQALPADAAPSDTSVAGASAQVAQAALRVPTRPKKGEAWIQGSVQDRAQRTLDGVVVQAFADGDTTKSPAASALTYAPNYRDGHGWFRLYGLKPGVRYKVRFTSAKTTQDSYVTTWSKTYTLTNRQVVELSATTLTLTRKVSATLTGAFADASIKPTQRARLKVSLTSKDVKPVAGDIWVKIDKRKAWSTPIKAENNGALALSLPKLALGTHKIALTFGGNDAVVATRTPVSVTLRVTKKGR